jgi:hypothetical protein
MGPNGHGLKTSEIMHQNKSLSQQWLAHYHRKLALRSRVIAGTALMIQFRSLWYWFMGGVWKSLEKQSIESRTF